MTIKILSSGKQLDLPLDIKLSIEMESPIFSNASSMSLPISIPLTMHNKRILNFPDVLNLYDETENTIRKYQDIDVIVIQSSWQQVATMSISGCSDIAAEATLYFNESNIWTKIEDMTLPQAMSGLHYGAIPQSTADIETYRQNLYNALYTDFASYPFYSYPDEDDHTQGMSYNEWISYLSQTAEWIKSRDFVMAPIFTEDGWLNEIWQPGVLKSTTNGMYITAFLRLDYILHKIFEKAGFLLTIDFDSFPDENPEYSSHFEDQWHTIVVLNNTIDALYPGCMYYSALVPEMSCKDFLLAVQAQFGCAFFYQPDGSYKMKFIQTTFANIIGETITQYSNQQVTFNSIPDYNPADNIDKSEKANMVYEKLPGTQYDSYYSSGHDGWDHYPFIHTIGLDGLCQRTTTTTTDDEDSTKSKKCPLIFCTFDFAIVFHNYIDQSENDHWETESYPAIRKPYIQILDPQFDERDVSRDLSAMYFYNAQGLFQMVNSRYNAFIESCDKISIVRMMTVGDIATFDFAKPVIIRNRLCWPSKLQVELTDAPKQKATIEFVASHKIVSFAIQ